MTAWRRDDFEPGAPVVDLTGQLEAFPVDVPAAALEPVSVAHGAAQLALFDPLADTVGH